MAIIVVGSELVRLAYDKVIVLDVLIDQEPVGIYSD